MPIKFSVPLLLSAVWLFGNAGLSLTSDALHSARAHIKAGKFEVARSDLQTYLRTAPSDAEAHLLLGEIYARQKSYSQSKREYMAAMKLGKGNEFSTAANTGLLKLPRNIVAPLTGPESRLIVRSLGLWFKERGTTTGSGVRPSMIDFYASWAEPCKLLKPQIEKVKTEYANKVDFISVNVDAPESEQMIDKFGVSPVPTIVFLSPDGEVVSYSIGYGGEGQIVAELQKIMR